MDLNLFKNKIRKQDILIINGIEYTSSNIIGGVNYEQTVNSGIDIVLGSCTCATIEFEFMNLNNLINNLAGEEVTWKKRVETSPGVFEEIQMGIFIAEKPVKISDTRIRVKAYDRMKKFDVIVDDWLRTVSYPITLKNMLIGLCNYVGVPLATTTFLNDNYPVKFNFLGTNVKGRDVLKWIAEIAAKFAIINELGELRLGWYNNIVYSVNNSNYYSIKVEDYQVKKIDKLQVRVEENDIGVVVGIGTNAYVIQNNPLLYTETDAEIRPYVELIYGAIKDFVYVPYKIRVNDNPLIKAGNMFTVTTRKGQVFKAVIMSRKMTNGSDVFSATGNIDRSINKSLNTSIKQLRGKTNVLERTVEHTINRLYDEDTGDLTQLTQTVNSFNSRVQTLESNMNFRYQQDTAPENPEIGDVWFSTSNEVFIVNNLLMTVDEMVHELDYYSNSLNKSYRWNGSTWDHVEDGSITELRMTVSEIEQTAENIGLTVESYDGRIGTLELTANNLTSRIQNAEGDISEVTQTANTISSKILSVEDGMSEITQTATDLTLRFDNMKSLSGTDGTLEGGVTKISASGIIVSTASGNSKLEMLANSGFALWTNTGSGLEKKFYVDSSGKIQAKSLIIGGDSEFKGKINVGTDASVGNNLYLGIQTTGYTQKGLYFYNNNHITSNYNTMIIHTDNTLNVTARHVNFKGRGNFIVGDSTNLSVVDIIMSCNYQDWGTIQFRYGSTTRLKIDRDGIDFNNSNIRNLNIDRVSSVQDKYYSSRGIEFRIYNGKLQYRATNSSTWINLEA